MTLEVLNDSAVLSARNANLHEVFESSIVSLWFITQFVLLICFFVQLEIAETILFLL
jgi:hypothetical protein